MIDRIKRKYQQPDQDLIKEYKTSKDPEYVAALYYRYHQLIAALGMKYLKGHPHLEDAVSEIYEILLRDLEKAEVRNFSTWLFSVCRNHYLKTKSKEQSQLTAQQELFFLDEIMELPSSADLMHEKERLLSALENSIHTLGEAQQHCIRLFYLKGMSYHDVAEATGFSMNEVKSHIQNGKRNLRIHLEKTFLRT